MPSASGGLLQVTVKGWEDGEYREQILDEPWGGRWTLHTADQLELAVGDVAVTIKQRVGGEAGHAAPTC